MHRQSETALKARARALVEAMTARERWVYPVPPEDVRAKARAALEPLGFAPGTDASGGDRHEKPGAIVVVTEAPDLDVAFVEGAGPEAPEALAAVLDATGFFAQTTLLRAAHEVDAPEAPRALRTLAPMCAAWDARWEELFALHLGAADEVVRAEAARALAVAGRAAGPEPARALLAKALERESAPDAADAMRAALAALGA